MLAREQGEKVLLLITDAVPYGEQDLGAISLTGVAVKVAFFYCERVAGCEAERGRWTPIFAAAGAAAIDWYEPDEDVRALLDN